MARIGILERTREIIYGHGMGESPPIRQVAADAAETITNPTIVFSLASGEGSGKGVRAGQTLSTYGSATAAASFLFRVLSVSTDAITATNGYSTIGRSAADDLDGTLLEQDALVPEFFLHKAIDTVVDRFLYPEVFKFSQSSHTPNLSTYQADLAAADREILSAQQSVGGVIMSIGAGLERNVHSTVSANGVLGSFDYIDGSTCYFTTRQKVAVGDEDTEGEGLLQLIALGAAAISLGASVSETELSKSKKDSQDRNDVSATLWRDFLTLRAQYSEDLSRDTVSWAVYRG